MQDGQRLRECLQQAEAVLGEVAVKKALKNSLREASSELQAELARVSALNVRCPTCSRAFAKKRRVRVS